VSESGSLDIAALRAWIGRSETATETLSPGLVGKFCATFDLAEAGTAGVDAPLGIHLCVSLVLTSTNALGPDGHPHTGGFMPAIPLPRRMWAGGEQWLERRLRVGDEVRRTSAIADIRAKPGRSGLLCFVTVEHRFDVGGSPTLRERHDIVYRQTAAQTIASRPTAEIETSKWYKPIAITPALLFRYSAITFNSHRIHYDRPYCTEVEHYPGLVVHGPLQMTLLHQFAAELRGGRAPKRFAFRARAPAFEGDGLVLHAKEDGAKLKLWTCINGAIKAMEAEAEW